MDETRKRSIEESESTDQQPKKKEFTHICYICLKPTDLIQCCGLCQRFYHRTCLHTTESNENLTLEGWKCNECVLVSFLEKTIPDTVVLSKDIDKAIGFQFQALSELDNFNVEFIDTLIEYVELTKCAPYREKTYSLIHKWIKRNTVEDFVNESEIVSGIHGLSRLKRFGYHHVSFYSIKQRLEEGNYPIASLLGWNPCIEEVQWKCSGCQSLHNGSNNCSQCQQPLLVSKLHAMLNGLKITTAADALQLDIGCHVQEVLNHIKSIRPYMPFTADAVFLLQVELVCIFLTVMSNYGSHLLSVKYFDKEYEMLSNVQLAHCLSKSNIPLLGKVIRCVNYFDFDAQDRCISELFSFVKALNVFQYQSHTGGFTMGPASPAVLITDTILQLLLKRDKRLKCGYGPPNVLYKNIIDSWNTSLVKEQSVVSSQGILVDIYKMPTYDSIRNYYALKGVAKDQNSLSSMINLKLQRYMKWKEGDTSKAAQKTSVEIWQRSSHAYFDTTTVKKTTDATPDIITDEFLLNSKENSDDDDTETYEVQDIVESRINDEGQREYLVKWKNYPSRANTWEPEKNLAQCREMLHSFKYKQPKSSLILP